MFGRFIIVPFQACPSASCLGWADIRVWGLVGKNGFSLAKKRALENRTKDIKREELINHL